MSVKTYDDGADDLDDDQIVFTVYNADSKYKLRNVYVRDAEDGDADKDDTVNKFDGKKIWSSTDLSSGTGTVALFDYDEWKNDGYYDFLFEYDDYCVTVDNEDLSDYSYFVQFEVDHSSADVDGK